MLPQFPEQWSISQLACWRCRRFLQCILVRNAPSCKTPWGASSGVSTPRHSAFEVPPLVTPTRPATRGLQWKVRGWRGKKRQEQVYLPLQSQVPLSPLEHPERLRSRLEKQAASKRTLLPAFSHIHVVTKKDILRKQSAETAVRSWQWEGQAPPRRPNAFTTSA